jgi:hypothetical protein
MNITRLRRYLQEVAIMAVSLAVSSVAVAGALKALEYLYWGGCQ